MWDKPVTCEWVMSPVSGTRHMWMSHVTYEWTSHNSNVWHDSFYVCTYLSSFDAKCHRLIQQIKEGSLTWVSYTRTLLGTLIRLSTSSRLLRKKTCTQIGFFSRPFAKSTRLLFEVIKAIIINLPRQRYFSKCMGLSHIKSSPIWNVVPYEKSKALSHLIIDLPRQRGDGSWKAEKVGK